MRARRFCAHAGPSRTTKYLQVHHRPANTTANSTYPDQAMTKWNPEPSLRCGLPLLEMDERASSSPRAIGKHWVKSLRWCVVVTTRVGPLFSSRHSNRLAAADPWRPACNITANIRAARALAFLATEHPCVHPEGQAAPARERMPVRNRSRCSVISRIVAGGAAVW